MGERGRWGWHSPQRGHAACVPGSDRGSREPEHRWLGLASEHPGWQGPPAVEPRVDLPCGCEHVHKSVGVKHSRYLCEFAFISLGEGLK